MSAAMAPPIVPYPSRLLRRVSGHARNNPLAAAGVVLVIVFVVLAVFAPWIAPQDPAAIDLPARLNAASRAHWFGTDELGRDILSRVIYGARISMLVGSCVVLSSLGLGLMIGSVAGYYGGSAAHALRGTIFRERTRYRNHPRRKGFHSDQSSRRHQGGSALAGRSRPNVNRVTTEPQSH